MQAPDSLRSKTLGGPRQQDLFFVSVSLSVSGLLRLLRLLVPRWKSRGARNRETSASTDSQTQFVLASFVAVAVLLSGEITEMLMCAG